MVPFGKFPICRRTSNCTPPPPPPLVSFARRGKIPFSQVISPFHAARSLPMIFGPPRFLTHATPRYNSDPGHRYKLRVIQVNRLTQVFNSQRTRSADQNSNASYRLEDSRVKLVPYIAIVIAIANCHVSLGLALL